MKGVIPYTILILIAVMLALAISTLQFPTGEILKQPRGELPTVIEPEITPEEEIPAEEISTEDRPIHTLSTNVSACGVISSPGDYVLDANISDSVENPCLIVYSDDVIIDGNGYTMDGVNPVNTGIEIYSDYQNVTIKNLTLINYYRAIYLQNGNANVLVDNVTLAFNYYGLYYGTATTNATISNNYMHDNDYAVMVSSSSGSYFTMVNNVLDNNYNGLAIGSGKGLPGIKNCVVQSNIITNSIYDAVGFITAGNNTIDNNTLSWNQYNGFDLIRGSGGSLGDTITNNNFSDNYENGLAISSPLSSSQPESNVTNNTFNNNWWDGVSIEGYANTYILSNNTAENNYNAGLNVGGYDAIAKDNIVSNNTIGILTSSGSGALIANNTINQNGGSAIKIDGSSNSFNVTGNIINNSNVAVGIELAQSINTNVYENDFLSSNYTAARIRVSYSAVSNTISNQTLDCAGDDTDAIYITGGYYNKIDGLTIENCRYGLYFQGAGYDVVNNNTITNSSIGIYLASGGAGNNITNNNLSYNIDGIRFTATGDVPADYNNISNNVISNNSIGINRVGAGKGNPIYYHNSTIKSNIVTNNTLNGILLGGADCIIENNTIMFNGDGSFDGYFSSTGGGLDMVSGGSSRGSNIIANNNVSNNSGYGIKIIGVTSEVVTNNTVYSNQYGIMVEDDINTTYNDVKYNSVHGIYTSGSNLVVKYNNITENNDSGIYDESTYLVAANNTISNNNISGIYSWGDYGTFTNNTIEDNGVNGILLYCSGSTISYNYIDGVGQAIYLSSYPNNIVSHNEIVSDADGILLETTSNNNITNNNVHNCSSSWIHIIGASESNSINDNNFSYSTVGINISDSNNNQFSKNTMFNNLGSGIYVANSQNTSFDQNVFVGDIAINTTGGYNTNIIRNIFNISAIQLSGNNNNIELNTMTPNFTADAITLLATSENNSIKNNTITNATNGVLIQSANNNNITRNQISNSSIYGIQITGSTSNNIWDNKFENNANAHDDGTNNWNITKNCTSGTTIVNGLCVGGNYWSDYNGTDNTGDFLGDTNLPYRSSGNISTGGDYLPLIIRNPPPAEEIRTTGSTGSGLPIYSIVAITGGQLITFNNIAPNTYELSQITGGDIWTSKIVILQQINGKLEIVQGATPSESVDGIIYTYISADATGFDTSAIDTITLSFKVPKSWLTANGLNAADVVLLHYNGAKWSAASTSITSEDDNYVYFEATSPDLSYFAIGQQSARPSFTSILDAIVKYYAGTMEFTDVLDMIVAYYHA